MGHPLGMDGFPGNVVSTLAAVRHRGARRRSGTGAGHGAGGVAVRRIPGEPRAGHHRPLDFALARVDILRGHAPGGVDCALPLWLVPGIVDTAGGAGYRSAAETGAVEECRLSS